MAVIKDLIGQGGQAWGGVSYAQHGEDLIFLNIFDRIGVQNPSYLDIGAHHPVNISNTALLYNSGSRGVNVEANPDLFQNFVNDRSEDMNLNIGVTAQGGMRLPFYRVDNTSGRNSFDRGVVEDFVRENPQFKIQSVIEVPTTTINNIVEENCNGIYPDILSIDVEGLDLDILRSANFAKSKPTLICIETGSQRENINSLLAKFDYNPYFLTVSNMIYLQIEVIKRLLGHF
jgi:FkbM family methyltransferase